jgi:hypothetical protein
MFNTPLPVPFAQPFAAPEPSSKPILLDITTLSLDDFHEWLKETVSMVGWVSFRPEELKQFRDDLLEAQEKGGLLPNCS